MSYTALSPQVRKEFEKLVKEKMSSIKDELLEQWELDKIEDYLNQKFTFVWRQQAGGAAGGAVPYPAVICTDHNGQEIGFQIAVNYSLDYMIKARQLCDDELGSFYKIAVMMAHYNCAKPARDHDPRRGPILAFPPEVCAFIYLKALREYKLGKEFEALEQLEAFGKLDARRELEARGWREPPGELYQLIDPNSWVPQDREKTKLEVKALLNHYPTLTGLTNYDQNTSDEE